MRGNRLVLTNTFLPKALNASIPTQILARGAVTRGRPAVPLLLGAKIEEEGLTPPENKAEWRAFSKRTSEPER